MKLAPAESADWVDTGQDVEATVHQPKSLQTQQL